jgi:hypothetical protein
MVEISDKAVGDTKAAPTPCAARPASSISLDSASPQTSELAPKIPMPAMKNARRPNRSPARPARTSKPPNVSA